MRRMSNFIAAALAELVAQRAPAASREWFSAAFSAAPDPGRRSDFITAFSGAGRRLGSAQLAPVEPALADSPAHRAVAGRALDEAGRVALLLAAPDAPALARELFLRGDAREKQAVLRALPLLPGPAALLDVAVEACRSSVQTIFEAIACENPFPADHFPDAAFNQLVLKALFIETRVARIDGLERRANPELLRMVQGYESERRAAGRTVPADIEHIRALAGREADR